MNNKEYVKNAIVTESNDFNSIRGRINEEMIRLFHSGMGLCTETGEFLDMLKKYIFYGKELDKVNLKEEIGDIFWYIAIACDVLDVDIDEIMERNIEKLKARYGDKFNKQDAINRDLEKERQILEK
jgi:NTP pyrophosphatase (non-canonical NTP hydrolase)